MRIALGLMLAAAVTSELVHVAQLDDNTHGTHDQERWGFGGLTTMGSFALVMPSFKEELGASASLQSGGCPTPDGYKVSGKYPLQAGPGCTGDVAGCTHNDTQVDAAGQELYRCTILANAYIFSCDSADGCGCAEGMCRVCYDMSLDMNEHMSRDHQKHCRLNYLEAQKRAMQQAMVMYGECSEEKVQTHECGIYDPAPAPTPPPTEGSSGCQSISAAVSDAWCTSNCNHVPPNCPQSMCSC